MPLQEFWVRTVKGGLYHVSATRENNAPLVTKLEGPTEKMLAGDRLRNGSHVGITLHHILLYSPEREGYSAAATDMKYWGGGTSPPEGLFLDKERARIGGRSYYHGVPWDWEWLSDTVATLRAIGENHPVFRIDEDVIARLKIVSQLLK